MRFSTAPRQGATSLGWAAATAAVVFACSGGTAPPVVSSGLPPPSVPPPGVTSDAGQDVASLDGSLDSSDGPSDPLCGVPAKLFEPGNLCGLVLKGTLSCASVLAEAERTNPGQRTISRQGQGTVQFDLTLTRGGEAIVAPSERPSFTVVKGTTKGHLFPTEGEGYLPDDYLWMMRRAFDREDSATPSPNISTYQSRTVRTDQPTSYSAHYVGTDTSATEPLELETRVTAKVLPGGGVEVLFTATRMDSGEGTGTALTRWKIQTMDCTGKANL